MALSKIDGTNLIAPTIPVASGGTGSATLAGAGLANTPAFMVLAATGMSVPDSSNTAVTFDTEIYDTDSAVVNGLFTCPSGKAGKYFFTTNGGLATANDVDEVVWAISKNAQTSLGSTAGDIVCANYHHDGTQVTDYIQSVSAVFDVGVGDTVGVRCYQNYGGPKNTATDGRCTFSGYKLI
jgi:hypothetical protein